MSNIHSREILNFIKLNNKLPIMSTISKVLLSKIKQVYTFKVV